MRIVPEVVLAVLLMCPRVSLAQAAAAPAVAARGFVDLNLIGTISSPAQAREFTGRFVTFGEAGSSRATYPKPSRSTLFPLIDVGGGYMAGPSIGLGMNLSRASFEDVANLATTIPHPLLLNAPASADAVTNRALTRDETMLSAFVAAVPLRTPRAELRIFGGPTYFWLNAEMVKSVLYSQVSSVTPQINTITITGFESEDGKGRGLGFHVGGDFSYFVTKRIGVRGGARYSHANVTMQQEPLSKLQQKIKVGGPMVFLGVRFRFGK